jgi:sugar transferase (PEP-CTERM system associated)
MIARFHILLILGDVLISFLALVSGACLRFGEGNYFLELSVISWTRAAVVVLVILFSSFIGELYHPDRTRGRKELLVKILTVSLVSFFVLSVIYYGVPQVMVGRGILLSFVMIFAMVQYLWHTSYTFCLNIPGLAKRVLIYGTGPLASKIGTIIGQASHLTLGGYITAASEPVYVPSSFIVESGSSLMETALREKANQIVVSLSERRGTLPLNDMLRCKLSGIDIVDAPSFYEQVTGKLMIEDLNPSSLFFSTGFRITPLKRYLKRLFDILLSVIGLLIASPLMLVIAIFLKVDSKGPIFFRQTRVGEHERNFTLYKFRTMQQDAENGTGAVWAQENDPRVTRFGRLLRKTRLDEIPQLYNVFKGQMSFIGPRPERPEFVENLKKSIPYFSERHLTKPGITGWAQVKYPYGASVEDSLEKLRYDLFYIKNASLSLDLLIILETIRVVLLSRGGR